MIRWMSVSLLLTLCVVVGCGDTAKPGDIQGGGASARSHLAGTQNAALNPSLLEPLLLPQSPTDAISVKEAKTRKDGEKVVVRGKLTPDNLKKTNPGWAAFEMLSPEDFDRPDVKEEFECDDAATCPKCRKILDEYGVRVELVGKDGKLIPSTVQGFRGIGGASLITVEGVVKREGKDGKIVRIVGQRFYPG
jgi:hypothetical protein